METRDILRQIVDRVRKVADPQRIVLFGSQARSEARENSDFDILVVQPSQAPRFERSAPIYAALADLPVEVEVVVYTPREIEDWSGVPQAFVTTAIREGKLLYERKS